MPLKAVFLDVGNTLIHEKPSRFELYARAARARGAEVTEGEMLALMRRAHDELPATIDGAFRYSDPWFRAYVTTIFGTYLGLPADALEDLLQELFRTFEDPATFRLYPGALELLETLRAHGLRIGLVSNWSARLPQVLRGMRLDDAVDVVLCSAIERMEKPDAAIFRAALERTGVTASEALHAGDHPRKDVAAAAAVGIEGVLVRHAGTVEHPPSERSAQGVPTVHGLPELQALILSRLK